MYSFNSRVRYSECNENATLSILGLMDYLQDCSTFHSEHIGHGLDYMREHHFAWFVAAWQIQIERMPRFTEPITIATNCYDAKAAWAMRNFWIDDAQGNRLVKADSCWFTFDTQAHGACRIPEGESAYLDPATPKLDLPKTKRHLRISGEGTSQAARTVTEQMLDTNHHMNNAQYVEMAASVVREHDEAFQTHRICVQYKQMALLGDTIVPVLHEIPSGYAVDLAAPAAEGADAGETFAIVELTSK